MDYERLPLPNGKGVVLVDRADLPLIEGYRWKWTRGGYAGATTTRDGRQTTVLMHRLILPGIALIDHINGNPLDNRRINLRPATASQNQQNRTAPRSNTSGFKGVSWDAKCCRWFARIYVDGRAVRLGGYETAEEAGRAYDSAALEYHGPFARLNFPAVETAAA